MACYFPLPFLFFCLASLRPNPISHFNPYPLALGPEPQGTAVEIYPVRNGTPLQEQLTSYVCAGNRHPFVLCHYKGLENNIKTCKKAELSSANQSLICNVNICLIDIFGKIGTKTLAHDQRCVLSRKGL